MTKNLKILISVILLLECNANSSEFKDLTLKEISENTSTFISNFIPGEGITEASVELKDDNKGNGNYPDQSRKHQQKATNDVRGHIKIVSAKGNIGFIRGI